MTSVDRFGLVRNGPCLEVMQILEIGNHLEQCRVYGNTDCWLSNSICHPLSDSLLHLMLNTLGAVVVVVKEKKALEAIWRTGGYTWVNEYWGSILSSLLVLVSSYVFWAIMGKLPLSLSLSLSYTRGCGCKVIFQRCLKIHSSKLNQVLREGRELKQSAVWAV